jgi:alkylation response protein AidB-like acyl-CoA dehydrogenase
MRFAFDEDALLLASTVRDFLRKECPPEVVRDLWASETGHSSELWRKLAALGVPGALVPEAQGGMGLDERDLVLLMEEIGRAALPGPIAATAAVGAPLLRDLGGALASRWLPRLAAGDALLAVGHPASPFVTDAHVADLLLLVTGDELHAVEARPAGTNGSGPRLVRQACNDPGRRLHAVEWKASAATRIAQGDAARSLAGAAMDRGALACAAQLLGAAERMLELAVAHACQREQFGRPIGSFQAVQHQLADVKVRLDYARPVVYRASHSVALGAGTRARDVSHAKLAAGEAAALAARTALQVHGAIGYTWEQDLHLWMRRAWSLQLEWADAPFHLERVAHAVLAPDARIGPGTTFSSDSNPQRDGSPK